METSSSRVRELFLPPHHSNISWKGRCFWYFGRENWRHLGQAFLLNCWYCWSSCSNYWSNRSYYSYLWWNWWYLDTEWSLVRRSRQFQVDLIAFARLIFTEKRRSNIDAWSLCGFNFRFAAFHHRSYGQTGRKGSIKASDTGGPLRLGNWCIWGLGNLSLIFNLLQAAAAGRCGCSTLTHVGYVWEAVENLEALLWNSNSQLLEVIQLCP